MLVILLLAGMSACSWFSSRKHEPPEPTQLIVTGAPAGSVIFIDGSQSGQATAISDHPQIVEVAAGAHRVEIQVGEKIVYREDTYVAAGQHLVVTVLSGLSR